MKRLVLALFVFFVWVRPGVAETLDQKRQSYQSKIEKDLNTVGQRVDTLKTKSQKAGSDSRAEVDRQISNLESQLGVAREKLNALRQSTSVQWEALRHSLESTVKDLQKSYRKTATRVKEDTSALAK